MAIPFVKVFITATRLFLRPINQRISMKFKGSHGKAESKGHKFFVKFG